MKTLFATSIASLLLSTIALAADGKADYDKACKSCHGANGAPNPTIGKMMKVEMKDLGSADVQSQSDADLKKIVTDGKGKMKPIKTVANVDDVVAYIRTFKK